MVGGDLLDNMNSTISNLEEALKNKDAEKASMVNQQLHQAIVSLDNHVGGSKHRKVNAIQEQLSLLGDGAYDEDFEQKQAIISEITDLLKEESAQLDQEGKTLNSFC